MRTDSVALIVFDLNEGPSGIGLTHFELKDGRSIRDVWHASPPVLAHGTLHHSTFLVNLWLSRQVA